MGVPLSLCQSGQRKRRMALTLDEMHSARSLRKGRDEGEVSV